MIRYDAPLRDMRFVLDELLHVEGYADLPGFADAPPDVMAAILEEAGKLASGILAPLNAVGDQHGCTLAGVQHVNGFSCVLPSRQIAPG